jgi:HEAT repeat protein
VRTVLDVALVAATSRAVEECTSEVRHAPREPAAGHGEELGAAARDQERDCWARRLAGESLASLVDALAALLQATPPDPQAIDGVWQAIGWLVRLRPETAAEIRLRAAAGLETRLCDMLLSALGAAGTDAAQQALAAMRLDASLPAAVRTSATISLFQLARPGQRVLSDLAGDLARAAELTGDDAMAMLLLGALAPRAGEVRVGGRSAFDVLLAQEDRARAQGRLDLWLDALGNAGTEDVVPHAQRYAAHDDELVRGAAYHALHRVGSPAALALLERGLDDASAAVRTDVVRALGDHGSAGACTLLARAARGDADAAVRRAALDGLARMAPRRPAARQALEEAAQVDPDPANRAAARALLQGLEPRR